MAKRYWLMKSEPDVYGFDDLLAEPNQTDHWDGVRNYQARNIMRDEMKVGDGVLFYHSNTKPPHVVGVAEVVREGYPDHTAFDSNEKYYDAKSDPDNPRWYMVDIRAVEKLPAIVPLDQLKSDERLVDMKVTQRGQRLSVQPVTATEFQVVVELAKANADAS
ncbi:MAG: EVE domain-containing protein [Myxococcales bacterium]|nr:EVE domain-containing protein [Myxococcales bacterium]